MKQLKTVAVFAAWLSLGLVIALSYLQVLGHRYFREIEEAVAQVILG